MLTKSETHELIEPALYLILSGLPNTNEALIVTEHHIACIHAALESYRKSCGNISTLDTATIQEAIDSRLSDIQTSTSIGISRLMNGFYFHTHENANAALEALRSFIIQDVYISPNQTAIDLIENALNKAA